MPAPALRGRFVWHELMTTDPDAASRFYPGVTGWKVQAWEQDPSYRLWMTGGVRRGGLMRLPAECGALGGPPPGPRSGGGPAGAPPGRQPTRRARATPRRPR